MPQGPIQTTVTTCRFTWCAGLFCADAASESFHVALLGSEGEKDVVGVDLVCNDFSDGTSTGPLIDVTWALDGVSLHSVSLTPQAALRHAAAVARAAYLALEASK